MNKKNELAELAAGNCLWRESAEAVINGADIDTEVEQLSKYLLYGVYQGAITTKQLRGGVIWANALDKEAVNMYGPSLEGAQQTERTARRIMHHAGRAALEKVKSPTKQLDYFLGQKRQQNQVQ